MKKIVNISGKEYTMQSSAWTQFKYKNDTGRRMLQDLRNIAELQNADEDKMIEGIDELTEVLLKMAYVMIEEADPSQVKGYDEFLKGISNLYENTEWINQVVELATSPISRGI